MSLKIKSSRVIEDIVNENNEKIGIVSFDPEDAENYKKFLDLINIIEEYQKIDSELKVDEIPDFDLKSIEEFEKYRDSFNKIGVKLDNYLDMRTKIKNISDEIFGNVSEVFEKINKSLDPYLNLIEWASPYFKSKRTEKINEYLDAEEVL